MTARKRFLTATGMVVDLDGLLADQQRRRFELEAELARTDAQIADIEQRLGGEGPNRYMTMAGTQTDLDQALADTRARNIRLKAELKHLNQQLQETRRRIERFDLGRKTGHG